MNPDRTEPLFNKLLIANRGEIACRIIRTARRLKIPVVSVYSDADRNSLHSSLADESVYIGASRPSESYLNIERIMHAAKKVNADALHPGYGFLSENSLLSEACELQKIEFIGPPSEAIRQMASKSHAADIAVDAGVPVLPGFRESGQNNDNMIRQARKIGFPILLKAALGGGGRGMSIVQSEAQLVDSLETVRAQAREFFGDDLVIIEKYLNPARHVEVQVAADKHGNVVHLFDRDCSAQRRYQKIVEEAPAPKISQTVRQRMYDAAISLTKALDYHSVGTVEFLLAGDEFFFMEMNTRLQVEHPVTEKVTGIDLVEWQLRIAAGESISQQDVPKTPAGHSIQARIYAESPEKGFLPSPGDIKHLQLPTESENLQVHTGIRLGDIVDRHYDPLIAKIVVRDSDRMNAIERLQDALENFQVIGVDTNIEFLSKLLESAEFQDCEIDIKFVENHLHRLIPKSEDPPLEILASALLYTAEKSSVLEDKGIADSNDRYSPWRSSSGWRLNSRSEFACSFECGGQLYNIGALFGESEVVVKHKNRSLTCMSLRIDDHSVKFEIDGAEWLVSAFFLANAIHIFHRSSRYELRLSDRLSVADSATADAGSLVAPLPGRIARVLAAEGASVTAGQVLVVIEAMKMEHPLASPIDGVVTSLPFSENQLVDEGASCVVVEPQDD